MAKVEVIPAVTKVIEPEQVQITVSREQAEKLRALLGKVVWTEGLHELYCELKPFASRYRVLEEFPLRFETVTGGLE